MTLPHRRRLGRQGMNVPSTAAGRAGPQDRVSRVLIWMLLIATVVCWGGMILATVATYRQAAPLPQRMVTRDGATVMSYADIVAGKSGFQQADLMDYGSLYGMGSYFGEDYTAANLVKLATLTESYIGQARSDQAPSALALEDQRAYLQ
jgi:nitric oxide reductase subunit B